MRYADDFCVLCETHEQAKSLLSQISVYLRTNLGLSLNSPIVVEIRKGFEFLGITVNKQGLYLSEKKAEDLKERIGNMKLTPKGFAPESLKAWEGVRAYYAVLLPQNVLHELDDLLYERMKQLVKTCYKQIANRGVLKRIMSEVNFLSNEYQLFKKRVIQDYIDLYDIQKGLDKEQKSKEQNKRIIEQRKKEYRKREGEGRELLVSTYGCFIGLSGKSGVTTKNSSLSL